MNNKRQKVPLKPGHTLADWARICSTGRDLSGMGGIPTKVSAAEVKKHNTPEDCWVIFNGKVYNITPYLEYHPGGIPIITKMAGKDVTRQFYATHSWVNGEHLMRTCLVGTLVPDPRAPKDEEEKKEEDKSDEDSDEDIDPSEIAFPAVDSPQRM